MDKKRTDSSLSNDTGQERNETTSPSRTLDAPTPEGAPDGGWSFVTQAQYDSVESRDLTTVIIGAIADAKDLPIVEVKTPPLYEVVDIACIEAALFGRPAGNGDGTASTVQFRYHQYRVSVESDGWVTIADRFEGAATDGA